jgi:hypothetical protein
LARIAYGALVAAAEHLQDAGSLESDEPYLSRDLAKSAFIAAQAGSIGS